MSVDLPAPFSPSSAWTSPRLRSKSTLSLATSDPKRLVIPRSSRAFSMVRWLLGAAHRVGDVADPAVIDLLLDLGDLARVFLSRGVELAVADTAGLHRVGDVGAALVLAALDALDRVLHRHVDLLERAGEHLRAEVGLVGVDADALDALLLGGVEDAEAALAGDLEDDLRAARDLVERDLLALRLVDEVLGVAVQRLDRRVRRLGARLVAGDVVVDRRDLLAADARDRRDVVVLGVQAGEVTRQVAGLLLLEQQALDVGR